MFDIVSSTSTDTKVSYYNLNKVKCEKCDGTGYQQDNSGIFHVCPICDGTGWCEQKVECPPCIPYVPPEYPWYPMPWRQPTYDVPQRFKYIITC